MTPASITGTAVPLGTDIPAAVRAHVAQHYCIDPATIAADDTDLLGIPGADSLDALELALRIEDAFHITISDEEVDTTKTIGALVALVERKVQGK